MGFDYVQSADNKGYIEGNAHNISWKVKSWSYSLKKRDESGPIQYYLEINFSFCAVRVLSGNVHLMLTVLFTINHIYNNLLKNSNYFFMTWIVFLADLHASMCESSIQHYQSYAST